MTGQPNTEELEKLTHASDLARPKFHETCGWYFAKMLVIQRLMVHGLIVWSASILLPLWVWFTDADCSQGYPVYIALTMFALVAFSAVHERWIMISNLGYAESSADMFGEAKWELRGLDSVPVLQFIAMLKKYDLFTDALMIPQVLRCAHKYQAAWMATWEDSIFAPVAVPIFNFLELSGTVVLLNVITVYLLQGLRGLLKSLSTWCSAANGGDVRAAEVAEIAGWATAGTIQKICTHTAQKDIYAGVTCGYQNDPTLLLERASFHEIAYEVAGENIPQMYFTVSFFALSFEEKTPWAKAALLASIASSAFCASLKAKKAIYLKFYPGKTLAAVIVLVLAVIFLKVVGTFICTDTHLLNFFPPRCID